MCTQNQAVSIMEQAYERYSRLFSIRDCYLYGSYARGDYDKESDVDILMTVDAESMDVEKNLRAMARIDSDLSLENDVTVSVTIKPVKQFDMFKSVLPYYQNVLKEGLKYGV